MTSWQLDGYDELHELGVGGGGRVVLARHVASGRLVAIKYLAAWLATSEERLSAFRGEAELMAGLVDPNLVTLYEYLETDSGAAIVMELVEGVALRDMLEHAGPLTPQAALTLMKGSLLGLAALHRQGIVHRDYKPENVMVGADGATKLVDYGIAAPVGECAGIAGTPLYMAPEQWVGEASTPASDVYAATATFVESLTGQAIYSGDTTDALRHQHLMAAPPLDRLPAAVRGIAAAGLAKHPQERIGDAEALVKRLDAAAGDAHGPDWEAHGRHHLAARAAALALLFPRHRFSVKDHAHFHTHAGGTKADPPRRRGLWGAGIAAGLLAVAGFAGGAAAAAADQAPADAAATAYQQLPATVVTTPPAVKPSPAITPKAKPKPEPAVTIAPAAAPAPVEQAVYEPAPAPYLPPAAPVALPPAPAPQPTAPAPTQAAPPTPPPAPPATQAPTPPYPTWSPPTGPRRGGVPIRVMP